MEQDCIDIFVAYTVTHLIAFFRDKISKGLSHFKEDEKFGNLYYSFNVLVTIEQRNFSTSLRSSTSFRSKTPH
jgi:hypothetical protein